MPSGADLILSLLLGALVFRSAVAASELGDAGIEASTSGPGRQILAHAGLFRLPVDLFSSTMTIQPWFTWECALRTWWWVVVGSAQDPPDWWCITAVVIAAVFAWTFRLLIARGTNLLVALALVLLAVSGSTIHFLARPHVVELNVHAGLGFRSSILRRDMWALDVAEQGRRWIRAAPAADAGVE